MSEEFLKFGWKILREMSVTITFKQVQFRSNLSGKQEIEYSNIYFKHKFNSH